VNAASPSFLSLRFLSCFSLFSPQFGNTCYCNSVLQALYFCRPFREKVLAYKVRRRGRRRRRRRRRRVSPVLVRL